MALLRRCVILIKKIDFQVCILKNKVVDDINAQWGDSGSTNWGAPEMNQNWQSNDSSAMASQYVDASEVEGNFCCHFLENNRKINSGLPKGPFLNNLITLIRHL